MTEFFNNQTNVRVRALFISERIDLRILEETNRVALSPTLVSAGVFNRIEPLAANLQRQGRTFQWRRELLRDIGGTLLIQHKIVWRVELSDKPEILWERPELERLCSRLEIEYELSAVIARPQNWFYWHHSDCVGSSNNP